MSLGRSRRRVLDTWPENIQEIRAGIRAGNIRPDVNVSAQASVIYSFLRGQMAFAGLDPKFDVKGTTDEFIETLTQRLSAGAGATTAKTGKT